MDRSKEIAQLERTRNLLLLGALLMGTSTLLKIAGVFAEGSIPPVVSAVVVLIVIVYVGTLSAKIKKLQRPPL